MSKSSRSVPVASNQSNSSKEPRDLSSSETRKIVSARPHAIDLAFCNLNIDNSHEAALESKIATLEASIAQAQAEKDETAKQLKNIDAAQTVNNHIRLLHTYNEIRDIGTGLMGILAENRGVRLRDVYDDFGVDEKD
ncbi:MAG: hypothetical protein Q9190_002833 [Brigantiaea leucoxantha]